MASIPGGLQVPPRPLEFKSQPMPRQKRSGDERLGKRNRDLFLFRVFFQPATAVLVFLLWEGFKI